MGLRSLVAIAGDVGHVLQRHTRPWQTKLVRDVLATVCARLQWRHNYETAKILDKHCDDLIDEHEDGIAKVFADENTDIESLQKEGRGLQKVLDTCTDVVKACENADVVQNTPG